MNTRSRFLLAGLLVAGVSLRAVGVPPTVDGAITSTTLGTRVPIDTFDYSPSWSPDGKRLAFASRRDGNEEIYVMDVAGGHVVRLTHDPAVDEGPAWSPDGGRLLFTSDRDGNRDVFVMSADGSGQRNLTSHPADEGDRSTWSPDGRRIAFSSSRRDGVRSDLYVMNADGSGVTALTATPAAESRPMWSPDGRRLAFGSDAAGNRDVYVMNVDGTGVTPLTTDPAYDDYAAWSPDSREIAFIAFRDAGDGGDIYIMGADGSNQRRLTATIDWDFDPWFSPDGRTIAFNSRRDGRRGLFLMNRDGSNQRKITNLELSDFATHAQRQGIVAAAQAYAAELQAGRPRLFLDPEILNLSELALRAGRYDEAIAGFTLVRNVNPEAAGAFAGISRALRKAGRPGPPTAEEFTAAVRAGQVDVARDLARKALAFDPKWRIVSAGSIDGTATTTLGRDPGMAAAQARLGIELFPAHAPLHTTLGMALEKAGDTAGAIKAYEQAVALSETESVAKAGLTRLRRQ